MPLTIQKSNDFLSNLKNFDLLIDSRSPKEYAYSNIINSSNFFILDNNEYQEIGIIYKKNKQKAKVLGASYACQNIAKHLKKLNLKSGAKIGVYCARGGNRSDAWASILTGLNFQVFKLEGGYKAYRQEVLRFFDDLANFNFITLFGNTGCGKTEILSFFTNSLDLEKFANHKGSVFGKVGLQPSQKEFESNIFHKLLSLKHEKYILVEAESKKIGNLTIPTKLHERIYQGKMINITATINQRIQRILSQYSNINETYFLTSIEKISPYIKKEIKTKIINSYNKNDLTNVVKLLLLEYYDKVYRKMPCNKTINFSSKEQIIKQINSILI